MRAAVAQLMELAILVPEVLNFVDWKDSSKGVIRTSLKQYVGERLCGLQRSLSIY